LGKIFVRTENSDIKTLFAQACGQCADNVITFKTVTGKIGNTGSPAKITAVFKLTFKFSRCRWAIGLVLRKNFTAVGVSLFGIKGAGNIFRLFQYQ